MTRLRIVRTFARGSARVVCFNTGLVAFEVDGKPYRTLHDAPGPDIPALLSKASFATRIHDDGLTYVSGWPAEELPAEPHVGTVYRPRDGSISAVWTAHGWVTSF